MHFQQYHQVLHLHITPIYGTNKIKQKQVALLAFFKKYPLLSWWLKIAETTTTPLQFSISTWSEFEHNSNRLVSVISRKNRFFFLWIVFHELSTIQTNSVDREKKKKTKKQNSLPQNKNYNHWMEIFKEKMEGRVVRNCEEDKGKASGTMSWEGILVFSIERRVRKERDV